jgi:hypothetical protein
MSLSTLRLLSLAVLGTLGAGCAAAPAAPPTPLQTFERYVTALHAYDMPTIRSLLSDRIERPSYPGCTAAMNNKDCTAYYIENTMAAQQGRIKQLGSEQRGDILANRVEISSNLTRRAGVQRSVGEVQVRVEQGQFTKFGFVPDFRDEQTAVFFGTLGIGPRAAAAQPASQP